jgi:two-component system sensor histidine kinase HydH
MPRGGTLELALHRPGPNEVELVVIDTGPGITPTVMSRLFEPFVSTKVTGLGLGLSISRRIVEEHGGRLVAENRPGGGACFVLSLPLRKASAQRSTQPQQSAAVVLTPET